MTACCRVFVCAALALAAGSAGAQERSVSAELREWLEAGRGAQRYSGIAGSLMDIVTGTEGKGLPGGVLLDRIREGAAKAVSPQRLLDATTAEAGRLEAVAVLLGSAGLDPERDAERVYGILSLCLRGGIRTGTLGALLHEGRLSTEPLERALAAAQAILGLAGITTLEPSDLERLGVSLIRGRLPWRAFGSMEALFAKARSAGRSDEATLQIVVTTLERGGGMIQLSDAIGRPVSRRDASR